MEEILIQDFFEKKLRAENVEYEREYKLGSSVIDFVAKFNGKTHGIEVKSSYSNIYTAIGQLVNFSRFFSHLILVAPKDFLDKLNEIVKEVGILRHIGIVLFENGNFFQVKEPSSSEYFFKGEIRRKKERGYKGEFDRDRFTEEEEKFFRKFKGEYFMVCDVVKTLKKTFDSSYHFISRLRKLGLVEEVRLGTKPKTFKITNKLCEMLNI